MAVFGIVFVFEMQKTSPVTRVTLVLLMGNETLHEKLLGTPSA